MDARVYDGLTPEEIAEEIVWGVEREFVETTAQLLIDRLNKVLTADDVTAQFLLQRLKDTIGIELYNVLYQYNDRITDEVKKILTEGVGQESVELALIEATGHVPSKMYTEGFNRTINALVQNCTTVIRRYNVNMINGQDKLWYQVANRAISQKVIHSKTTDQIIREAVSSLQGITRITYTSGASISIDAGIRRHINSQVGQAWNVINEQREAEYGWDLWMCSSHALCRPTHYEFQGQLFSKSKYRGQTIDGHKVKDYYTMDIGDVTGIYGANCQHYLTPYVPHVSQTQKPPYTKAENDRLYGLSQDQRSIERNIRNLKTEIKETEALGKDAADLKLRLRKQQTKVRNLCNENDLIRRPDLEKAYL